MDKSATLGVAPGPASGVVTRFSAKQSPFGGYIADDRSQKEIYVHRSALTGVADLSVGTRVDFQIIEDGFGGSRQRRWLLQRTETMQWTCDRITMPN